MRSTWVSCRVLSTYRKHCFAEPKRDVTWDNSLMHSKACISITTLVTANRRTLTIQLLDFRAAAVLMPADASIQADIVETERLLALTKKEAAAYVARQPKPPPMMSFSQGMSLAEGLDMRYIKLPPFMDMRAVEPPVF